MFEHGTGTEYAKDPKGQPCFAGHSSYPFVKIIILMDRTVTKARSVLDVMALEIFIAKIQLTIKTFHRVPY